MEPSALAALAVLVSLQAYGSAAPTQPPQTSGFVASLIGANLTLDDGTLVRLGPATKIVRPNGTPGTRDDISRQGKVVLTYAPDGTVAEVRAFPPRSVPEVYLSNLPPMRGSAVVTAATVGGELDSHSLALFRTTYPRQWNWLQFRSGVRYDPRGATGAPGAARFALKDSFGDVIVERVVSAGDTARLDLGLDAQATDRLTLEVAPLGEGPLQQDWCLWLDPRFVVDPGATPGAILSRRTIERLAEALTAALGQTKVERLGIAEFTPVRVPADQFFPREVSEQLLASLGRRHAVTGIVRRRIDVGAALDDGDRAELAKIGAAFVVAGSVSARQDGTVVNAIVVQVANGAFIAAASVRE
jgi:TolB-like protein